MNPPAFGLSEDDEAADVDRGRGGAGTVLAAEVVLLALCWLGDSDGAGIVLMSSCKLESAASGLPFAAPTGDLRLPLE